MQRCTCQNEKGEKERGESGGQYGNSGFYIAEENAIVVAAHVFRYDD